VACRTAFFGIEDAADLIADIEHALH